ncbi:BPSL0761 family protein [Pseudomonas tolaasii]|uniref:BPSL0761 family protein n=1 Tax=Pseudomonas tolaasii TaxID=29442 RepID=UPI0034D2177D
MTRPNARVRSLIQTRDFLIDLSGNNLVPESVRLSAFQLLRQYPTPSEILIAEKFYDGKASTSVER